MTREEFLRDVSGHRMRVLLDDGCYRHLKFASTGSRSWNMWFQLVTWPGYLAYSGDCGAWTFTRVEDMFRFFRSESGDINPHYWSEKIEAEDRTDGTKKFSREVYAANILESLDGYDFPEPNDDYGITGDGPPKEDVAAALRELLEDEDLHEVEMRRAVAEFEHDGFRLSDPWEIEGELWTRRYLWCCHAIVWGIQQYDEWKARNS